MDITTIVGIILAALTIGTVIAIGGDLAIYVNFIALFIVFGCTIASILINTPLIVIKRSFKALYLLFFSCKYIPSNVIPVMVKLSEKAKRNGIFSIQNDERNFMDGFLNRAVKLTISGIDKETIRKILEREIVEIRCRHREIGSVIRTMALFSPVFGMFGTLVGVVLVLRNIGRPDQLAPAMSEAILSSIYGIFFSYIFFLPAAGKLKSRDEMEIICKEMILEGILAIHAGDLPSMIERCLQSYLERNKVKAR